MDPLKSEDVIGKVFLHYQVIERLGAGGMGVVYRATDMKLKRPVALKFLPASHAISEEFKQRFMREAMAASAVDHPNIGTLHSIEETSTGELFLVMSCYEGPTLAQKMAHGPLPADEAVGILLQVAQGLKAAHAHGIVHRDIKPGNIIFASQGVVKILDFGLAKLQDGPELTTPGTTLGTAAYMAPEQAMGTIADHRADLWSTGVVFHEMLSGGRLFSGSDMRSTLFAVMSREPSPIPGLAPQLERVLKKSLQRDPDRRYQTAAEMIADLEAARGSPFVTGPLPVAPRVSRVTGVSETVREKRHPRRLLWIVAAVLVLAAAALGIWLRARRPAPLAAGTRIVVMPIAVTTQDAAKAAPVTALADGLRTQLIDALAGREGTNPGLLVVTAAQMASQHVADPATARTALGADLAITGSLTESAGQLHVVLSSVDTATSNVLKSEVIDGSNTNLSALSERMAQTAAGMLGLRNNHTAASPDHLSTLPAAQAATYLASLGYLDQRDQHQGNLDAAIAGFSQVVQASPGFGPAYARLAECFGLRYRATKDAGALALADQNATRAAQIDANSPEVLLSLGQVRLLQGRYPEAIASFQRLLTLDGRSDGAYRGLARVYAATGLPDKAEDAWQKAISLRPNSIDDYNQLATFELGRANYSRAADDFRKALSLAPANATIMSNLGAALLYAGSLEESRRVLQQSIRLAPNYASYTNLGDLELKQGRYAEAAADYEKALEMNKNDYQVWSNLAVAYSQTPGQKERARDGFIQAAKMCREALKANPNDPVMLSDLAMFIASEGDERQEPLVLIERALALAPQDTYVQFNAAETYESLGYRKEALDWLAKLVAAGYPLDDINHSPVLADLVKDKRYLTLLDERKKAK